MKKVFLSMIVAMLSTVTVSAQQIAVVKGGATKVYNTLKDAIEGAEDGSVVYLPGGGFPIADTDTIRKKLTIIGITHKASSDNADGRTTISGNLFWGEGSTGSALMGCYVTGTVNIGTKTAAVSDIMLRYNNINAVVVNNSECRNIVINQNYIRNNSDMGKTNVKITNNILHSLKNVNGGTVSNNIINSHFQVSTYYGYEHYAIGAENTVISGNVLLTTKVDGSSHYWSVHTGSNCEVYNNMVYNRDWGQDGINVKEDWSKVFEKDAGVSVNSKYHFIDDYKQYENTIGLYAGTGFSDGAMPPVPYIKECKVDEQTDAEGKLNIRIKVKAVTE